MRRMKPETKRKVIAVVAILLVITMLLGVIAPFLRVSAYGAEQQPYTVEARMGFDGAAKINGDMPVSIEVTNNSGKTFKGKVSVMPENDYDEGELEYFSDIEIAAGETKIINSSISVYSIENEYKIQLVDNGGKPVEEFSVQLASSRDTSVWLGVLTDDQRVWRGISEIYSRLANRYGVENAVLLTENDIDYIFDFNILVVKDIDLNKLDPAKLQKVGEWISRGGIILTDETTVDTQSVNFENFDLMGRGSVYVLPSENFYESILFSNFVPVTDIVENNNSDLNRPYYFYYTGGYRLERPADDLGSVFLMIIMAYAVIIGPVLFAVLKKKDKKEKAVKYIPLSAACLSAVIVVCSFGSSFQRPLASAVNLVDASQGGIRTVSGMAMCAAPSKGKLEISNSTLKKADIDLQNLSANSDNKCSISLDSFDYRETNYTKWDVCRFTYGSSMELSGGLEVEIGQMANDTVIYVTNNTGYDLKDICVNKDAGNSSRYAAEKLKNGESLQVSVNTYSDDYETFEKMSNNNGNKTIAAVTGKNGYYKITGFIDKDDITGDFMINGRKASKNEVTALYVYASVDDWGQTDAWGNNTYGSDPYAYNNYTEGNSYQGEWYETTPGVQ